MLHQRLKKVGAGEVGQTFLSAGAPDFPVRSFPAGPCGTPFPLFDKAGQVWFDPVGS